MSSFHDAIKSARRKFFVYKKKSSCLTGATTWVGLITLGTKNMPTTAYWVLIGYRGTHFQDGKKPGPDDGEGIGGIPSCLCL